MEQDFDKKKEVLKDDKGYIQIDVKPLIEWSESNGGGCIVSDKITKDGWKVGYMFRDEPMANYPDSGWRFLKGDEDDEYMDNSNNHHIFAINTLCNYDPEVIPYLSAPIGTCYIRTENGQFVEDDGAKPIHFEKQ